MDIIRKKAIITGGASGIGKSTAFSLLSRGASVLIVDINLDGLEQTKAEFKSQNLDVAIFQANLADESAYNKIFDFAKAAMGGVDIIMNNVGVIACGNPHEIPIEEWQRIINLNLMSIIRSNSIFIPHFIAQNSGYIVNTASFSGLFPYAYDRLPYAASKAALITISEGLYLYLKPKNIGISCICPGPVKTNIGSTIKFWSKGAKIRGPGAQFLPKSSEEVGEIIAQAIESEVFFVPTDDKIYDIMEQRAQNPNAFINQQLASFD